VEESPLYFFRVSLSHCPYLFTISDSTEMAALYRKAGGKVNP
jgi:hypothetical protein